MKTTGRIPIQTLALLLAGVAPAAATSPGAAHPGADCRAAILEAASPEPGRVRPAWAGSGMPDAVWRLVDRASVEEDDDLMRCLLNAAEQLAGRAVEASPEDADRRYALAVVVGLRADREGGRARVQAASRLHEELRRILELAPGHAPARHLLGRLHAGVLRMDGVTRWVATHLLGGGVLGEATWEEAEENLAFAEAELPDVPDHHYELANLYGDTGREALAVAELEHVLALEPVSAMEVAVRVKAERLLQELSPGR
ncbi:MAG TPA: hypothetical protein VK849_15305 [Longimicrobiales bacterium]|nr:hypothetical protein [Longimicrobiales bacterium]